jgi:hypothetical protein
VSKEAGCLFHQQLPSPSTVDHLTIQTVARDDKGESGGKSGVRMTKGRCWCMHALR